MVPSDDLIAQQIAWEEEGLRRGVEAYHTNFERTCAQGGGNATGPGMALVSFLYGPLEGRIREEQQAVWSRMTDRKPKPLYDSALIALEASIIATIAASTVVAGLLGPALHDGVKRANLAKEIGSALQAQIALEQFRIGEKERLKALDAEAREEKRNLVDLAKRFSVSSLLQMPVSGGHGRRKSAHRISTSGPLKRCWP
ncbi:hypothetical protein [Asaia prunellae]|uniref:hypothetical protein n=1 Tax=Asaia prunellae TaxID=610245 RepID=UPI000470505D|nr:hypothetical protein [Asaia prunellae]